MLILSRKLFHAVEAVLYIAYNSGHGPISSRDIAQRQGLPARYLEQIMQKLVRAEILRGIRGPRGGYLLAREKRRISVGDICQTLSEQADDGGMSNYDGTPLGELIVRPVWENAQLRMLEQLKQVTLAELCEQATAASVRKDAEEKADFTI